MDLIDEIHERVHGQLKAFPNALNTLISTKKVKDIDTGIPCITILVSDKVEERLLAPAEIIPKTIEGIPTDVVQLKPKTWKAGKTKISELSPSEQRKLVGLKAVTRVVKTAPHSAIIGEEFTSVLAARLYEIDWEAAGKTTPFKDQKDCGSCTATGSESGLQDDLYVIENIIVDLSIQDLFFGSGGTCEGGNTMEATLDYLRDKGVALTQDCPYDPALGNNSNKAEDWYLRGKKILSWSYCSDLTLMKEALNLAPITTTMAVHYSFLSYVDGIYESQGDWDPIVGYHCLETIGCSDSRGCWKGKNSWNGWGRPNSVFEIKYGDSEFDKCMYIFVPNGPIPAPSPTPSPCGKGNASAKVLSVFPWLIRSEGRFYYLNPPRRRRRG